MNAKEKLEKRITDHLGESGEKYELKIEEGLTTVNYRKKDPASERGESYFQHLDIGENFYILDCVMEHELIRDKQDSILEFVTLLNFFLSKNIGFFIFDDNSIWFRSSQILVNDDKYIDGRTKEILFSYKIEELYEKTWPVVLKIICEDLDPFDGADEIIDSHILEIESPDGDIMMVLK